MLISRASCRCARRLISILTALLALVGGLSANAVTVRNYNVNRTTAPPTLDGIVSPGEWDAASPVAGQWGVLRETEADLDTENNRFRMLWDTTNLYLLYQTDFKQWVADADLNDPATGMNFGIDNINLYFDPNQDNEPNFTTDPENNVDGYQLGWTQPKGPGGVATISTAANHQGVGFFTEAHVDTPFGDQAHWNRGGADVQGGALQDIVLAQRNGAAGGVAELRFPWANFNADATIEVLVGGVPTMVPTGLDRVTGPVGGEQWYFNATRINGLGDQGNFLPILNWHEGPSFAPRPHGTITFMVPEPASWAPAVLGAAACVLRTRQARIRVHRHRVGRSGRKDPPRPRA